MVSSLILGYASMAAGEPLKPFYYDPPELGANDVRVSVTHCGLCHTDIQAVDDYYDVTNYPFVPGHEIVGYVAQVGNGVSGLHIGDRVGIGWQGRSCMNCEWCLKGEEQMCMDIVDSGTWVPYGGFSSSVIADYRFAYPLPEAMPSETAAVLMCAGISVFSPLHRYAQQSSMKVAIMGVGGLGHLAIQFSHALNHEVTVISSSLDKLEQAKSMGADHFILSTDQAELRQHYFYFDLLLVTATGQLPWYYLSCMNCEWCKHHEERGEYRPGQLSGSEHASTRPCGTQFIDHRVIYRKSYQHEGDVDICSVKSYHPHG